MLWSTDVDRQYREQTVRERVNFFFFVDFYRGLIGEGSEFLGAFRKIAKSDY
jgi:hypothetical protein